MDIVWHCFVDPRVMGAVVVSRQKNAWFFAILLIFFIYIINKLCHLCRSLLWNPRLHNQLYSVPPTDTDIYLNEYHLSKLACCEVPRCNKHFVLQIS